MSAPEPTPYTPTDEAWWLLTGRREPWAGAPTGSRSIAARLAAHDERVRREALTEFAAMYLHDLVPHCDIGNSWYHRGIDAAQAEALARAGETPDGGA